MIDAKEKDQHQRMKWSILDAGEESLLEASSEEHLNESIDLMSRSSELRQMV